LRKQQAEGMTVPGVLLDRALAALPDFFHTAQQARLYNTLTGASVSHFEIEQMGIFERDQVELLVSNADLVSS
jgi:hypothetical protein